MVSSFGRCSWILSAVVLLATVCEIYSSKPGPVKTIHNCDFSTSFCGWSVRSTGVVRIPWDRYSYTVDSRRFWYVYSYILSSKQGSSTIKSPPLRSNGCPLLLQFEYTPYFDRSAELDVEIQRGSATSVPPTNLARISDTRYWGSYMWRYFRTIIPKMSETFTILVTHNKKTSGSSSSAHVTRINITETCDVHKSTSCSFKQHMCFWKPGNFSKSGWSFLKWYRPGTGEKVINKLAAIGDQPGYAMLHSPVLDTGCFVVLFNFGLFRGDNSTSGLDSYGTVEVYGSDISGGKTWKMKNVTFGPPVIEVSYFGYRGVKRGVKRLVTVAGGITDRLAKKIMIKYIQRKAYSYVIATLSDMVVKPMACHSSPDEVGLHCGRTEMIVTIPATVTKSLLAGSMDDVHDIGPLERSEQACHPVFVSGGAIRFVVPYERCGSRRRITNVTIDWLNMFFRAKRGRVMHEAVPGLEIVCRVKRESLVRSASLKTTGFIRKANWRAGSIGVTLQAYKDGNLLKEEDVLHPNGTMFMRLETEVKASVVLGVHRCEAVSGLNGTDAILPLVSNINDQPCLVKGVSIVVSYGTVFEVMFRTFRFQLMPQFWLQCDVRVCVDDKKHPSCQKPTKLCGKTGKRVSGGSVYEQAKTITAGPFILN